MMPLLRSWNLFTSRCLNIGRPEQKQKLAMAMGACRRTLSTHRQGFSFLLVPSQTRILSRCYLSSSSFATLDPSCFCPSLGSLVDISEYLINGCNWKNAPPCPDYVGPVSIRRTPDSRGRGLYASRDVMVGDILLISNAFAATYDDKDRIEMFFKIVSILKESPKALRQYYFLAGDDDHDNMEVPDVKIFDPNTPFIDSDSRESFELDEKRIIHIMNVNSFAGELKTSKHQPETRLTGLWLLPSFINHSCSPNASRLVVGEAMFIIASRNIQSEEEINISYTDVMSPLKRREDSLAEMGYGFLCQCKRCLLERSLQQDLKEISEPYHALYDKAAAEVYSAVTTRLTSCAKEFPVCIELSNLYDSLLKKVTSLSGLTKTEQQWIVGGYSCAFLGKWVANGYSSGFNPPSDFVNSTALDLVKAMKCTEPGIIRTLSFATILASVAGREKGQFSTFVPNLLNMALDECIRIYGKQRLDVAVKLIEQAADLVPFF